MSLPSVYYQNIGKLPEFFQRIREAQAPKHVTQQLVKDWGFSSSNDRALIPLLKAIGFLSADGQPTKAYVDYRDNHASRRVLGQAIRTTYADLFNITNNPKPADRAAIQGKFKSTHNTSDLIAGLMMKTFFALLDLADVSSAANSTADVMRAESPEPERLAPTDKNQPPPSPSFAGLHYNIQIHLPASKDVEVYNAIFKSLKEHLIE